MHFVTFLYRGHGFDKRVASYGPEDVAALASMLRRHGGHRLTCVHDGQEMPDGVAGIRMPASVAAMTDYMPKLWAWSPEFHALVREPFAGIDLDTVVLADLAPVLETDAPIRLWDSAVGEPYNTSLFTLTPGRGTIVWLSLTPERVAAARAKAERWNGDQSWIAHALGPTLPTFGEDTGVIRYRRSIHVEAVPQETRAVFFCGPYSPRVERERSPWVAKSWH